MKPDLIDYTDAPVQAKPRYCGLRDVADLVRAAGAKPLRIYSALIYGSWYKARLDDWAARPEEFARSRRTYFCVRGGAWIWVGVYGGREHWRFKADDIDPNGGVCRIHRRPLLLGIADPYCPECVKEC